MRTKKKLKVLYVCPFAHYTGHFSWAAVHETEALAQDGIDVDLLTFCGVTEQIEVKVASMTVPQQAGCGGLHRKVSCREAWPTLFYAPSPWTIFTTG
jgi:hypothetical protein